MIHITELVEIDDDVVDAIALLIPQLSSTAPPPSLNDLSEIAANPNTALLAAHDTHDGSILGILTFVLYRIPTGLQARIDDVVVDEAARSHGVGELLTKAAIQRGRTAGAKAIGLTSRPSREAANRLYLRMGFEVRDTNVYQMQL